MRCTFCFATYASISSESAPNSLRLDASLSLISKLRQAGFRKITFAGGEPTLCPWLDKLVIHASQLGLKTSVVTNGSLIDDRFIESVVGSLDWLVLSIDSVSDQTNRRHGRALIGGRTVNADHLVSIAQKCFACGIRTKVNTVVTGLNSADDLRDIVRQTRAERWKIFRVLPIAGENDIGYRRTKVELDSFQEFVRRNSESMEGTTIVSENNEQMTDSYVMIDPEGRFLGNSDGHYECSEEILLVGVTAALAQVRFDYARFVNRGGIYDW